LEEFEESKQQLQEKKKTIYSSMKSTAHFLGLPHVARALGFMFGRVVDVFVMIGRGVSFMVTSVQSIGQFVMKWTIDEPLRVGGAAMDKAKEFVSRVVPRTQPLRPTYRGEVDEEATALALQEKTKWEKIKERMMADEAMERITGLKERMSESDNPVLRHAVELGESFRETARETKQVFSEETETAEVVGEIRKIDPEFSLYEFYDQVREDLMARVIFPAYHGSTEHFNMFSTQMQKQFTEIKNQQTKRGFYMDSRLLHVDDVELVKAAMDQDVHPILVFTVQVQQSVVKRCLKTNAIVVEEHESVPNQIPIDHTFYNVTCRWNEDEGMVIWFVMPLMSQPMVV